HADRPLLGAGVQLQVAEVVDACAAEIPLDPPAGAVVVAEEGEHRPGAADDGPDVLAAAAGEDGVARRLVRQQHVKAATAQRRRAAAADPGARRNPLPGVGALVVDAPQRPDAQPARQPGDVPVADAAQLAVGIDREAVRFPAGAALPLPEQLV